jgi:hypothetical protein
MLRAQVLALIWARVLRVWLHDDDPGLARTMAALDKGLREAERAAKRLDWLKQYLRPPAARGKGSESVSGNGADLPEGHPS